jgi:glutathione-regulated potassium-efflux system ancillary protein KefC
MTALLFLGAAVVFVPLSKYLGLGSVLGYLAAGAVIRPIALRFVDVETVRPFSEFGVVLLMFLVGLELLPSRLWQLRRSVFGLGGAQVVLTALIMAGLALALGLGVRPAVVAGMGLALSSTAFALQVLAEKNQLATAHGRHAFAILLFQDLAVIPMISLVGALGTKAAVTTVTTSGWWKMGEAIAVFVGIFFLGRYLLKPIFKVIASTHSQEVFTAATLILVFGVGLIVEEIGMSMAFGAFLAGLLLADSDYRHELEADIEPFKGLLLGLFFLSVGMSVNFHVLVERPLIVLALVVGYTALKLTILFVIGRIAGNPAPGARTMAISISQGGEFAFVLFGLAVKDGVMDAPTADLLVLLVTLSMALTPVLFPLAERLFPKKAEVVLGPLELPEESGRVVVAGFGRWGQVIGRVLLTRGIPFTALDKDPAHIEFIKQFGSKVYFGDATRLDLLRAAKVDKAEVFVLAIDNVEESMKCAELVRHEFPELKVLARARNRQHAYRLMGLGITVVGRETFAGSVEMARDLLVELGLPIAVSDETVKIFREKDEELLLAAYQHAGDLEKLKELAAEGRKQLAALFQQDAK